MKSPFHKLLATTDRAIDRGNAEPFVFHPQKRSANGRPVPDQERHPVTGQGIYDLPSTPVGVQLGNRSNSRGANDLRTLRASPSPRLSVRASILDGVEVRQGDRVDLPDRGRGKRFEVVSVQPDGQGRVMLELVER